MDREKLRRVNRTNTDANPSAHTSTHTHATVATASTAATAAAAATSTTSSKPDRLAALRARRDALLQQVADQRREITSIESEINVHRQTLSEEADNRTQVLKDARCETNKMILIHAFLEERQKMIRVWKEYIGRLKQSGRIARHGDANSQSTQSAQFVPASSSPSDLLATRSQQLLRQCLAALENSFRATLDNSHPNVPDSDDFLKLTHDKVDSMDNIRQLFEMMTASTSGGVGGGDTPSSLPSGRLHPAQFLRDLLVEMKDESAALRHRAEEVRNGVETTTNKSTAAAAAAAAGASSAATPTPTPPKPTAAETISSLITSLQNEASSRFLQSQKLSNETYAQQMILDELLRKQRENDALILDAPPGTASVTLEQRHHLASVRRLQDLQLQLAALKSQLSFARKTYDTFGEIAAKRQLAWDTFEQQREAVKQFPIARKSNEQILVAQVIGNKALRKKMKEYEERARAMIRTDLVPVTARIQRRSIELLGQIGSELQTGLQILAENVPFSPTFTSPRHQAGNGRTPIKRFALHQLEQVSMQNVALHAVLADPFGTDQHQQLKKSAPSTMKDKSNWKGWHSTKLYLNPTRNLLQAQEEIERGKDITAK